MKRRSRFRFVTVRCGPVTFSPPVRAVLSSLDGYRLRNEEYLRT